MIPYSLLPRKGENEIFFTHMGEEFLGVRSRNRPLRGFATHREANTPSEASAEGSELEFRVGVGEWWGQGSVRRSQGSVITNQEIVHTLASCKGSYPQRSEIP